MKKKKETDKEKKEVREGHEESIGRRRNHTYKKWLRDRVENKLTMVEEEGVKVDTKTKKLRTSA